ncbi:MAG: hypothetical protein ACP5NV_02165 [Candidatus Woesearchaeota archaeon]
MNLVETLRNNKSLISKKETKEWVRKINNEEDDGGLYIKCAKHRDKFKKEYSEKKVLVLVHPLDILREELSERQKKELGNYLITLQKALSQKEIPVIMIEYPWMYAIFTHKLLEGEHIKDIIFTKHNTGTLREEYDFQEKHAYLAGMYAGRQKLYCLGAAFYNINQQEKKPEIAQFINDLIINSPKEYKSLMQRKAIYMLPRRKGGKRLLEIPEEMVTTLDKILT